MDIKEILKHVDHTLLLQGSTWEEIKQICDDAMKYETASVCIAPSYVKEAAEYMNGRIPVCTVIGFPNGYMTTAAKEFETKDALANGASEIDMVINIGWLKDKKYDLIENEIKILKAACARSLPAQEQIISKHPPVLAEQVLLLQILNCLPNTSDRM